MTSDTHFSHARISELADRPFSTVAEMDAAMIRRWNDVIAPDSVVLHLGDVALGPIEESIALTAHLHGRRFLVPGNHDRVSPATQSKRAVERFAPLYEAAGWEILPEVIEGTRRGYRILASHYPYAGAASPPIATYLIAPAGTTASRYSTGTPTRATMARTGISFTWASTRTTSHLSRSA
ncbi:metallophosphoesterase [Microbacterium sp. CH1]|uniref:metallophosphoesterase n=1 Tax=Microbacterium sp. CH1 TaxID=1770208 RepID=UPI0018D3D7AD|nr:metallophosphoesterase [Microbacterium sp. CH1]